MARLSNREIEIDQELEDFIADWHWNKASRNLAREMGTFLFQFIDHLYECDLTQRTIDNHIDNCWLIGWLTLSYGHYNKFSPKIFLGEPSYLYELKRKWTDSKYAVNSYKTTWRKLAKYVTFLGYKYED